MRRSVRNGIAIAGMAGGVWLLGQAVAQADQTNNTGQDNTQSSTSQNGSGVTGNIGGNANSSSNTASITVSTNVSGGNGGTNTSNVNTGVQGSAIVVASGGGGGGGPIQAPVAVASSQPRGGEEHHSNDANGSLSISTHSVSVEQNANGGSVSGSGNITELPSVNQTNNVWQSNTQSASSKQAEHNWWNNKQGEKKNFQSQGMGGGFGGLTGNLGGNFNESSNDLTLDVSTNVYGGNGGYNDSNVNTGVQDAFLGCFAEHGDAWCKANIETGSVAVLQNANGGNVSDSGNIGAQPAKNAPASSTPAKQESAAVSPASAPAAKHAAALSSAQPSKGSLAFTGANVSLALTLGLLALGLGGAFTLAGRRRETGTV